MRKFIGLIAVAVAGLALAPQQQQPQVRTVGRVDLGVNNAALSPNGRFLAISSADSLRVMDVTTGRHWPVLRRISNRNVEFGDIDWSPKGDMLAFSRGDDAKTPMIWTLPMDQNTGRPNGEPMRVSTSAGDMLTVSPDGQSIVFVAAGEPPEPDRRPLVQVPARGGRERVLIDRIGGRSFVWSDDGKWIYHAFGGVALLATDRWFFEPSSTSQINASVARVPIAGGLQQIVSATLIGNLIKPGPMIVVKEADRMFRLVDLASGGTKALFRAPQSGPIDVTAANADASRFYAIATNSPQRLVAVSLADGSSRLLDMSEEPHSVATSQSGNRIAYLTVVDGKRVFVAANQDGSGRREYRTLLEPERIGQGGRARRNFVQLSPDGRHLVFVPVASDLGFSQLVLLDLQNGRERVVATAGHFYEVRWRSDGVLQYVVRDDPHSTWRRSIREVTVDGTGRLLRLRADTNVRPERGETPVGALALDDTLVALGLRDGVYLTALPRMAANHDSTLLEGQIIFRGPHGDAVFSPDHRFLAVKTATRMATAYAADARGLATEISEADAIAIVDLQTGQTRTIPLEFRMQGYAGEGAGRMWWHPDGRHLIAAMHRQGELQNDVYLVPVNGDPPRMIVRGSSAREMRVWPTADGRSVLLSIPDPTTTDIIEFTLPGAKPIGLTPRTK